MPNTVAYDFDAVVLVLKDVSLDDLPDSCPWSFDQIMSAEFWPD